MKTSLLIWVTLLITASLALFEWVHPDEWQPEHKIGKESVFDEIADKASHATERAKSAMKETGHNVMEGTKELGEDIGHKFKELRKYKHASYFGKLYYL